MNAVERAQPSAALTATGVVAVLRAPSAEAYRPVVSALVEAGVLCIELTLTTPGTIDSLPELFAALPAEADLGVGTVLTIEHATAALDAGARFLVTPDSNPETISVAVDRGVPVYAGALTPSEAARNWRSGASAVKLFPASTVGTDFIRHLHGPFPGLPVVPSGGVAIDDIPAWIRAGAVAVSLGGPLLGDAFDGGDLGALQDRARAALQAVRVAREQR